MNYQSPYQSPLNSVAYQFQNLGIRGSSGVDPSLLGSQSTSSPFLAAQQYQPLPNGHGSSLVNGWGEESAHSSPYPSQLGTPGVGGSHTNLLAPQLGVPLGMPPLESQWRYIDTQGVLQGPFGSGAMSQWYASGYFQHTLQICRVGTSAEPFGINDKLITLGDLVARVSDIQDPFGAFDRLLASSAATPVAAPIDSSLLKQQQQQALPAARIESGDLTHNEILELKDQDGGYYREVVVQVPVSRKNLEKLDPAALVDTTVPEGVSEVAREPKETVKPLSPVVVEPVKPQEDRVNDVEAKRQQKAEQMAKKLLREQELQEEERKKKEELRKLKKQQKQVSKPVEQPKKTDVEVNGSDDKNLVESEITIDSTAPKTPVAPWANKTKNVESPRISIAELHKREGLEQSKRNEERDRMERATAAQLQKQIFKEEKAQKDLKSVLTWANKPAPPPVSVEIESPQQKKAASNKDPVKRKTKPSEAFSAEALKEFNNPSFIEEQTKLWEKAQREKASREASTTTTTTHTKDDGNEWTTITSKATNLTNNVQPRVVNQPKSYVSPDKLRVVGGTSNKQIGSFTSNPALKTRTTAPTGAGNRISHRQDFLRWCRSQMKLNPSVETNSVLEVLLSLPAGSEAKEIIADTIYSNSSTMDGRRFAAEFVKRRMECERLVKDPLTWSEALALPEGTEDDWEFQVVSKKKGRKHRAE